jgi:hypothetical protein
MSASHRIKNAFSMPAFVAGTSAYAGEGVVTNLDPRTGS